MYLLDQCHMLFQDISNLTARQTSRIAEFTFTLFVSFPGVFEFDPDSERVEKLCGNGPKVITNEMLDKLYKYSSGQKKFTNIYAKQFSVSIDAFTIKDHLWQSAKSKVGPRPRPMTVYS